MDHVRTTIRNQATTPDLHQIQNEIRKEKNRKVILTQTEKGNLEKRTQKIEHSWNKRIKQKAIKREERRGLHAGNDKEVVASHEEELGL